MLLTWASRGIHRVTHGVIHRVTRGVIHRVTRGVIHRVTRGVIHRVTRGVTPCELRQMDTGTKRNEELQLLSPTFSMELGHFAISPLRRSYRASCPLVARSHDGGKR